MEKEEDLSGMEVEQVGRGSDWGWVWSGKVEGGSPVAVPSLGPERKSQVEGGLRRVSCPGAAGELLSAGRVGPGAVEGQRT